MVAQQTLVMQSRIRHIDFCVKRPLRWLCAAVDMDVGGTTYKNAIMSFKKKKVYLDEQVGQAAHQVEQLAVGDPLFLPGLVLLPH